MPLHKFKKSKYKYGFHDVREPVYQTKPGLTSDTVEEISSIKSEPEWMRKFRLDALKVFEQKQMPGWGADLSSIDFDKIIYYIKPWEKKARTWDEVPQDIKNTFDKIGVPEAEKKFFAGAAAQYDSDVIYHALRKNLERKGVIFTDMDTGLREYPEIVKKYFSTVIPVGDNKFAALNSACWSGGSFIYVPPGVKVEMPLQAYFRINSQNMGQFERTLIIADEGSEIFYLEGCTAPVYSTDSLHAAVVEIIAKPYSHVRYTTVQNWSRNVYNLVTKRARAEEGAFMEWVDCNLGSKITMKFPSVVLAGRGARGDTLSVALAGPGQHQDAGAKMIHIAPDTISNVVSKSVSFGGGRTSYRGLSRVVRGAKKSRLTVRCDALLLDPESRTDTYPTQKIDEEDVRMEHEAKVSKIGEKELFYLRSRGLSELEAASLIVTGFFEPLIKELPVDYAVEMNRLIQLEMEGSVG
ncbi:MAG: FeS assembly protein SufB [Parcubacteria group bacterium Gr01-1014_33]|nr:MAG: FeS assembly protein SufB [Parcubacteria group bacterium Gr01-1014_33]